MSDKIEPIPERWFIRCTPENLKLVGGYYNKHSQTNNENGCYTNTGGFPILHSHNNEDTYIGNGRDDNKASYSNFFADTDSTLPEITTEQFKKYVMRIEDFPEKWVIERDAENYTVINDYLDKKYPQWEGKFSRDYGYIHSEPVDSIYYGPTDDKAHKGFIPITFEQFKEHVLKQEIYAMKNYKVKKSELKKIHDIACSGWKPKIEELVKGSTDIFSDEVSVNEDWIAAAIKASTKEQISTVKEVFREYVQDRPEDKNAFVRVFPNNSLNEVSDELFGDKGAFRIAEGWAPSPELQGRCFGVSGRYTVETLEHQGRTIIKIFKK